MKELITKKNIDDYLIEGENEFYVNSSMILSPGAKDILRNKGIVITYGDRKVNCKTQKCEDNNDLDSKKKSDSNSSLTKTIVDLIAREFKIIDAEIVEDITIKVLNRLKKID